MLWVSARNDNLTKCAPEMQPIKIKISFYMSCVATENILILKKS